jgi:hypothetical protein
MGPGFDHSRIDSGALTIFDSSKKATNLFLELSRLACWLKDVREICSMCRDPASTSLQIDPQPKTASDVSEPPLIWNPYHHGHSQQAADREICQPVDHR